MKRFGEILKKTRPDLVVSPRHDKWLEENSNPVYSERALVFMREQLSTPSRERQGTFSASSLNTCMRRQQFIYLGMPQLPPTPKTAAIFQNGQYMHLRWQMAGLTEGWLDDAEVSLPENDMGLHGTMDGRAYDGSVVELKSINDYGFNGVNTFGPKEDHLAQVGTYVAASGAERGVIIYENKNTQEYVEFVVSRDALPITEVREQAERLWTDTAAQTLHEPLDSCIAGEGYRYTSCPFRDRCLQIKSWEHAEERVDED